MPVNARSTARKTDPRDRIDATMPDDDTDGPASLSRAVDAWGTRTIDAPCDACESFDYTIALSQD